MFKKLLSSLTVLAATSFNIQAFEIDTEACAGTEFIRDQENVLVEYDPAIHTFVTEDTPVFYAGEEQIPHIEASARANTSVFVTNTTSSIVSFFFNPVFHSASGEVVTDIPNLKYTANFSSSNNPLSGAGANMSPNTIGIIDYQKNNSFFLGYAEILWDSSTCFDTPPLVTTVGQNIGSTTSYYYVNDGNNW